MIEEQWKDIKDFEGYYQISNYGKVRSLDRYILDKRCGGTRLLRGRMMKLTQTGRKESETKYLVVNLRRDGWNRVCMVHVLVAEHFTPNPDNLPTVNHIDGNKSNNYVENLEWASFSKNNQHALDNNLRQPRGTSIIQYTLDGVRVAEYKSEAEATRQTGIGNGGISHCITGISKTCHGYIWKESNTVRSNDYPDGEYGRE